MTPVAKLRGPVQGATCSNCGVLLPAPDWSEPFSEEQVVYNFWSCTACGHRFETEAALPAAPRSDDSTRNDAVRSLVA
ncbi:MAG: hypothetical protein P8Y53_11140 [Pseudolabrys sp.]